MAQHLLSDLVSYFTIDEINIDDWTFKLYYKASTILCILGASVGVAQAYFGGAPSPTYHVLSRGDTSCPRVVAQIVQERMEALCLVSAAYGTRHSL